MKTSTIIKSLVTAVLLSGGAVILQAQDATPACPFGHEPGYGRSLTPKQRSAQRAVAQQLMAELHQKQADGTLTAGEQAWLERAERRGGQCLTGTPRGPRAGQGQGPGDGMGQRRRQGPRDGTGPRSVDGTCPNRDGSRQQNGQ